MYKPRSFTLAEVLITLGIIGIVAAMTLPTLVGKYQKVETATKLKKAYTILQEATKRSEVSNGELKYWDFSLSSNSFYTTYYKPHLSSVKEFINTAPPLEVTYSCLKGSCSGEYGSYSSPAVPKILLSDGTLIAFDPTVSAQRIILVDVNGYKKPNKWGRDMFAFSLQSDIGLVPYGYGGIAWGSFGSEYDRDLIINSNNDRACNKQKDGVWCAALIMMDGWEIRNDYPWQ